MTFELRDCTFFGPALPEPFVRFQLEAQLTKLGVLPRTSGPEGKALQERWEVFRRKLRDVSDSAGATSVRSHVLQPLVERLGYASLAETERVQTREGLEDGGWLFKNADGSAVIRAWAHAADTDLDAPNRRGRAYRFSPSRVAQRVLLAKSERLGLLTDGQELRLLICDPARPDSYIAIRLGRPDGWRGRTHVPDSFRLLVALARAEGVRCIAELTDAARLAQSTVTKKLREQARRAVEEFVQGLLDDPRNAARLAEFPDRAQLARELWHEGLILVYRLLFVLKLESSSDPARSFTFASTDLWRDAFSPSRRLADVVRAVSETGEESGSFLESSLRALFRLFAEGISVSGLVVSPLGGMLFGADTTPIIDSLAWSESAVAKLLDNLLWTSTSGRQQRERVHYGTLDVEDLGRVYEALLELEPGISTEPMCRLRRAKLEVVLPLARGEKYRASAASAENAETEGEEDDAEYDAPKRSAKTKVQWIAEIAAGRFYLRVGLGRKATGSYYTPHPFVRFLVQETLGPQIAERSPSNDPKPAAILALKVLDPAMGSGHFLVESCRYLGDALYEACRLCDELAVTAEEHAAAAKDERTRADAVARAKELRARVAALPDPADELVSYLPSRVTEGSESGLSQRRAEALCRRLVAVHCLYGVDKNPLAVELAKLALWLESYAEGMPLTFMDHRLACGDSLTGPFVEHLLTWPSNGRRLEDLFAQELESRLRNTLASALTHVRDLEATVGKDVADLERKQTAHAQLVKALAPFRQLAAAWTGAVMHADAADDRQYERVAQLVVRGADPRTELPQDDPALHLIRLGADGLSYDLSFPELFHVNGESQRTGGFDVVLGNPPWEGVDTSTKEFFGAFDLRILDEEDDRVRKSLIETLQGDPAIERVHAEYRASIDGQLRVYERLFQFTNKTAETDSAATPDTWQPFAERACQLHASVGQIGIVVPSSFHANDGAAGLRRLFLHRRALGTCFSFENKRELFEIHRSFKFALVVARGSVEPTKSFRCAFYLHEPDWLFGDRGDGELEYTMEFLRSTTGDSLNFLELRSRTAVPVALTMYRAKSATFGELRRTWGVLPTEELHTSKQRHRTRPLDELAPGISGDPRDSTVAEQLRARNILPVCKGEHFHHFDPAWGDGPTVATTVNRMAGKERSLQSSRTYRLVLRRQASSTNERTVIAHLTQPGLLYFDSAVPESRPFERSTSKALALLALCSSFSFDWLVRQLVASNVTFNFLDTVPVPALDKPAARMTALVHSATRLLGQHRGYCPLWVEQLGESWREDGPAYAWPAVADLRARWTIRASIDAMIAHAYTLDRAMYERVLASFSHKSYPSAPDLCLAAFDELQQIGLEPFCKKHDPYWDIPLNESLPEPAIDFPELRGEVGLSASVERGGKRSFVGPDYGPLFRTESAAAEASRSIPTPRAAAPQDSDEDQVYASLRAMLTSAGVVTSSDVQQRFDVDSTTARTYLRRLVDEGHATVEGQKRGTRYRAASKGSTGA